MYSIKKCAKSLAKVITWVAEMSHTFWGWDKIENVFRDFTKNLSFLFMKNRGIKQMAQKPERKKSDLNTLQGVTFHSNLAFGNTKMHILDQLVNTTIKPK